MIIKIIIVVLLAIAFFFILADILGLPFKSTLKAFSKGKRHKNQESKINIWLEDLSIWLSKKIKINEYKKSQLEADLMAADIDISAERHIADSIIKSCLIALLAIPIYFVIKWLAGIILALAIMLYFVNEQGITKRISERRKKIEYELPRFCANIEKNLKHSRDVLSILENYNENAGCELKRELGITIADMRTGNYEAALTRLESRVGSSMLSDISRGLISVMRGNDATIYFNSLTVKFSDFQRQLLKKEANKVPRKVNKLSMTMMGAMLLIYIVVLGTIMIDSMGVMFG